MILYSDKLDWAVPPSIRWKLHVIANYTSRSRPQVSISSNASAKALIYCLRPIFLRPSAHSHARIREFEPKKAKMSICFARHANFGHNRLHDFRLMNGSKVAYFDVNAKHHDAKIHYILEWKLLHGQKSCLSSVIRNHFLWYNII